MYIERDTTYYMYICMYVYMYIYIYTDIERDIYIWLLDNKLEEALVGGGDDTLGIPHRAQISQFELFELILLLKLDERFPVERFQAAVSQSAVPSSPLTLGRLLDKSGLRCLECA